MGSSRKKMKKTMDGCERLVSMLSPTIKKKKSNKASSSLTSSKRKRKRKRSQDIDLKDTRKLGSNDEAFHLSSELVYEIAKKKKKKQKRSDNTSTPTSMRKRKKSQDLHFKDMLKLSSEEFKDTRQLSSIDDAFHLSSESVYETAKKKKKMKSNKTSKRKKRSQYVTIELKDRRKFFCKEFKDMRKLSSNDEPFHLSWSQICKILAIIRSRKTPTPDIYVRWGEYAISFYLKMCTCFGVDYQHLEATDCGNKLLLPETSLKEQEGHTECSGVNQPSTKEVSYEEHLEQEEHTECSGVNQLFATNMSYEERVYQLEHEEVGYSLAIHRGPFEFGSYSSGRTPDYIPYHLYLLVKEAVDIMKRSEWHKNTNDLIDLTRVEAKIRFFCTYFHSHLPTDWEYRRDKAGSVVAGYDTTRQPRYDMAGYTPIGDRVEDELDDKSGLSPKELMDVMSIIHSRKTPTFWEMGWQEIIFYCKLCSCFGIDYHCLEAASEDDVCLMNMGRNG